MIDEDRKITLIDTIRKIYSDAACDESNAFDYSSNILPQKYTIAIDRFILNDLYVFLESYKKEITNNDLQ